MKDQSRARFRHLLIAGIICSFLISLPTQGGFPRPGQPSRAERFLSARGFELDTPSLLELAGSKADLEARAYALDVLSSRPEEEVKGPLLELLRSNCEPLIRRKLAIALAGFGEESAFEILHVLMRQATRDSEQSFLAATLASLGDLEGYPLLIAGLRSESLVARSRARRALFDLALRDTELDPPLDVSRLVLEALEDPESWNRREALSLVARAVDRGLSADAFRVAVERLAAEDPAPDVREYAAVILSLLETRMNSELNSKLERLKAMIRERQKERLREWSEEDPPP